MNRTSSQRLTSQLPATVGVPFQALVLGGVLGGPTSAVRTATVGAPASHAVGAGDAYLAALTLAVASGASTAPRRPWPSAPPRPPSRARAPA